ncbi:MAG: hypothetical protein M0Q23_07235 [Syntrophales bacterium]|jgi:Mn2+/Fe2+ NRAMP family transporter|nr:hypothetical protein [Syntrophales bacterium]MCK9528417.1 hypothetical protein [Syntrophales bacterium]MDX9922440.1 hypothetical protein [Syntrophales bacterium]
MTGHHDEAMGIYGIRKMFLLPLAVITILVFVLTLIVFSGGGKPMEKVSLTVILVILICLLIDSLSRKALVSAKGIVIRRFMRTRDIAWDEITNIDAMVLRKKAYLLLSSTKGFHVISNNLSDFSKLVSSVFERTDNEKIEPAARKLATLSVRRISDIILLWLASGLVLLIMWYKVTQ